MASEVWSGLKPVSRVMLVISRRGEVVRRAKSGWSSESGKRVFELFVRCQERRWDWTPHLRDEARCAFATRDCSSSNCDEFATIEGGRHGVSNIYHFFFVLLHVSFFVAPISSIITNSIIDRPRCRLRLARDWHGRGRSLEQRHP